MVLKPAMVATIVLAARKLGVVDKRDGSERVAGHSLRTTGAQGLIALGWRADAVQLQGRWESEAVKLYTREAALRAPIDLGVLMALLTGMARSELPPPPDASPEPSLPHEHEWILNPVNDMYHLASRTSERT